MSKLNTALRETPEVVQQPADAESNLAEDDALGWRLGEPVTSQKPTQIEILSSCVAGVKYWHDPEGNAFATVPVDKHIESYPIRSKAFRVWLHGRYFREAGSAPSAESSESFMRILQSEALYNGTEHKAFRRVAKMDGKVYIDLGTKDWRAIEVSGTGWHSVDAQKVPVKFVRNAGMLPLAEPEQPAQSIVALDDLFSLLSIADEPTRRLLTAYLVGILNPAGPYPVLVVRGGQGSGKTTLCEIIRALIDPNKAPLRKIPRSEDDFAIACCRSYMLALDNLSAGDLPPWFSDAVCTAATGSGYSKRELYTDADEILFDYCLPVVLNGIDDIVHRPDLLDRTITIDLSEIPADQRKSKQAIDLAFETLRPKLFGILLSAVSMALQKRDSVNLSKLPRMADFAIWVTAAESFFGWPSETALDLLCENQASASRDVLEYSALGQAILTALPPSIPRRMESTATELLDKLSAHKPTDADPSWPKTLKGFTQQLRRLEPLLKREGIAVSFLARKSDARLIVIERTGKNASSQSSSGKEPDG